MLCVISCFAGICYTLDYILLGTYFLLIITVLKGNNLVALYLVLFLYIDMKFLRVETLQNSHMQLGELVSDLL